MSPTSPDDGLFDVDDAGTAPGTRAVPAGQHPWSPSVLAALDAGEETQSEFRQMMEAQRKSTLTEQEFEEKVREGERRYNMDPEFRHRVTLLSKILFANRERRRQRGIQESIRAIVAIEEMDGGVLDFRLRQ